MPAESTQFKDKLMPMTPFYSNGLPVYNEGGFNFKIPSACYFTAGSGNPNTPFFGVADVTFGMTAPIVLIPDTAVPKGMRCYVTRLDVDVQGCSPWAGGTAMIFGDTASNPLLYAPTNALRGESNYIFPDSDTAIPFIIGQTPSAGAPVTTQGFTFTYTVAGTVATIVASGNAFPAAAGYMVGQPMTVMDATGTAIGLKGQSGIILTQPNQTTITLTVPLQTSLTGFEANCTLAFWYWAQSAQTVGAAVTGPTLSPVIGTPFVANILDNGFQVIVVSATTGQGQVRPLATNTNAGVVTVSANWNTSTTGNTWLHITNEGNLLGCIDMGIGDKFPALALNKGVQVSLLGTFTQGSPVRVYLEGFFAA